MKPTGPLAAGDLAAQHCSELTRPAVDPAEATMRLEQFASRHLAVIAQACAIPESVVTLAGIEDVREHHFRSEAAKGKRNCVLKMGSAKLSLVFSVDLELVLSLFDRALGGDGSVENVPDRLPTSVDRFLDRIERRLIDGLKPTLNDGSLDIRLEERGEQLDSLPFEVGAELVEFNYDVTLATGEKARARLAIQKRDIPMICSSGRGSADPAESQTSPHAFLQMPLELCVSLSRTRLSVGQFAALSTGDTIPIAASRNVDIFLDGHCVGRGEIGECEDHVAVQINHSIFN